MSESQLVDIKNLTQEELIEFLSGLGKERFRASQIMRWIYGRDVCSFDDMTDLAKVLRL